jgi:hypothetical protein
VRRIYSRRRAGSAKAFRMPGSRCCSGRLQAGAFRSFHVGAQDSAGAFVSKSLSCPLHQQGMTGLFASASLVRRPQPSHELTTGPRPPQICGASHSLPYVIFRLIL